MTDNYYIFTWWFFLFLIGLVSTPITYIVFKKFKDGGYGFSKSLGVLFISYSSFFLSTVHLVPFTRVVLEALVVLFSVINLFVFLKWKEEIAQFLKSSYLIIIFEELLFIAGLYLWAYVRSFQPDINGLEKFMDYGFVNSILQSNYLPPTDMWFAGKSINYYWFGHFITAFLTKLSDVPSYISYNLMLGTILGLSMTAGFSFVANLLFIRFNKVKVAIVGGLISAILLNFAGNFHTPYYIYKSGEDKYWYPDATRFIGYNPETGDKTIHEFPIYSYVVSDLHAHLLNLPFVILFMALLFNLINDGYTLESKRISNKKSSFDKLFGNWKLEINNPLRGRNSQYTLLILLGFILGIMFMANAWDFANYGLLFGVGVLLSNYSRDKFSVNTIYKTGVYIIILISIALLTALPFLLNFESIAEGVMLAHTKSPLWQLAILWGFPAVLTMCFLLYSLLKPTKPNSSDLTVYALLIAGWVLIALPEFIYVKDIYVATHYRANTMFKLTYQAFVMFYLTSGYIAVSIIKSSSKIYAKALFSIFFVLIFNSLLKYPRIAVTSYYGNLDNMKGLNGELWLKEVKPDTYEAIDWFRKNSDKGDVILEAPGDSYTEYNVISSYTGLPTVSGWFVHEWLWRGSPDAPQERVNDIVQIYTSEDSLLAKSLLNKYNVKFVILGDLEREKYPDLIADKFNKIGKEVFSNSTTKIYQIN